ncbi:MAG: Wzz/FepE/Etk N-terminal domain-containing protein [Gammaproteobacteria bacterium]|jgi:LPS O-antigen subunit length determinant protein (WzzB/FepE family)|nr:Wzz/FepE/Etk N-terminal domain-containing protein [Gammaproteobacteria bacterium]
MAIPEEQRIVSLDARVPQYSQYGEDELSLVDLFLVLERHKRLIAVVFAAITLLGVLYAVVRTPSYVYTSSIQLGRGVAGLLESPAVVAARLNESHIPHVRYEAAERGENVPAIHAEAPKDGDIVVLRSNGAASAGARHDEAHRLVIERLVMDQEGALNAARRNLQYEATRTGARMQRLQTEHQLFGERMARLVEQESALRRDLQEVREAIVAAEQRRESLAARNESQATAALVFVDGELSRMRERQRQLNDELQSGLAMRRDAVLTAELDNLALQADVQEKLGELEMKQQLLRPSAAMTPTIRATEPGGPGTGVIVAASLVLGLAAGVFLAFIAEFLARTRERRQIGEKV